MFHLLVRDVLSIRQGFFEAAACLFVDLLSIVSNLIWCMLFYKSKYT